MNHRPPLVVLVALALVVGACSSDDTDGGAEPTTAPDAGLTAEAPSTTTTSAPATTQEPAVDEAPADFVVRPSAEQVTVLGARPGASLELLGPDDTWPATADDAGNLIWRDVPAGPGYRITDVTDPEAPTTTDGFRVLALDDHPDAAFYTSQELDEGFGYVVTRDGTLLSVMVRLPGPVEDGPYPTVIEYSGHDPSNPNEPEPSMGVAGQLGFATVGVNMRGTGCSGGAFDYFEPLQSLDGYDVVEAVAAQPWVQGGQVGMVGVSYPGISQLFVAATRPPSLAAITPLSVIEDLYRSVVYPGGVRNDGSAWEWAESRQAETEAGGQEWVAELIASGDETCADNQVLRSQNTDLNATAEAVAYDDPAVLGRLSPRTFVDRIDVPVFLAGAWQDEQTGSRFATMLDDFTSAPILKATLYNGAHADALAPEILVRWQEFLWLYVAEEVPPPVDPTLRVGAPLLYADVYGADGLQLPPDRFEADTTLAEARELFEADPDVRVLMEMGADPASPGGPLSSYELGFDAWPVPDTRAAQWLLGADGSLVAFFDVPPDATDAPVPDLQPTEAPPREFRFDTDQSQVVVTNPDPDAANPFVGLEWPRPEPGTALVYDSAPLATDTVIMGSGSVQLWVSAPVDDVDLEVTLSEIRPDGQEVYVQSGWLRASHRTIDPARSDALLPFHTHLETDAVPLGDEPARLDVEIFPVAHALRAGSRLRLTVDAPGASRNLWTFDVLDTDDVPVTVDSDRSVLRLPLLDGVDVPDALPPCPGLRSQPCRPVLAPPAADTGDPG